MKRTWPNAALRIATGVEDIDSWLAGITLPWAGCKRAELSSLRTLTGLSCPDRSAGALTLVCARPDGSGWHIVPHKPPPAGPTDGFADHCFMSVNQTTCREPQGVDQWWLSGNAPWTFGAALPWLKSKM